LVQITNHGFSSGGKASDLIYCRAQSGCYFRSEGEIMGEKIWASFQGVSPGMSKRDKMLGAILWKKSAANGWTQTIGFVNLKSLFTQIRDKGWQVDKLAIVAHGGTRSGRIGLDRELSIRTIPSFQREFRNLASLFTGSARRIIFFSCGASAGANGDELWCKLSKLMPNCEIVGFSKILETGRAGALDFTGTEAGKMWELGDNKRKNVNEWSPIAKWARNDYIIRPTVEEVLMMQTMKVRGLVLNPKKLCGSLNCIGHRSYGDRCKNYHRLPKQYGQIMASYSQARRTSGAASISIPELLGVTDECGNLVLTGRRNRGLLTRQRCDSRTPKKKPSSLGRSRRRKSRS
jgi:hypothetical protein